MHPHNCTRRVVTTTTITIITTHEERLNARGPRQWKRRPFLVTGRRLGPTSDGLRYTRTHPYACTCVCVCIHGVVPPERRQRRYHAPSRTSLHCFSLALSTVAAAFAAKRARCSTSFSLLDLRLLLLLDLLAFFATIHDPFHHCLSAQCCLRGSEPTDVPHIHIFPVQEGVWRSYREGGRETPVVCLCVCVRGAVDHRAGGKTRFACTPHSPRPSPHVSLRTLSLCART